MSKIHFQDDAEKKRVTEIAIQLVESQAAKGELNVDDDAALKAAMDEAFRTALAAYRAALEYIS